MRNQTFVTRRRPAVVAALALAASTLTVAGCAEPPPPARPAPARMADEAALADPGSLAGMWAVTAVSPSGVSSLTESDRQALVGRVLAFSSTQAEDVSGRRCDRPYYRTSGSSLSRVLGYRQSEPVPDEPVTRVDVSCNGVPFADFVIRSDGSLMQDYSGAWASLIPIRGVAAGTVTLAPPPSYTATPAPAHATMAAGSSGIHLASYYAEGMAREGWSGYKKQFPELAGLDPRFVPVSIPGKGHYVRLIAVGADRATLANTCAHLSKAKQYCVLVEMDRATSVNPASESSSGQAHSKTSAGKTSSSKHAKTPEQATGNASPALTAPAASSGSH